MTITSEISTIETGFRTTTKQQRKEKYIQDDDNDNIVISEIMQESSLDDKELECNLIDDKDDTYDNNIQIIPTEVLFRMNDKN